MEAKAIEKCSSSPNVYDRGSIADVSKPSFYPLPTMTSSIFMPYSLAHAVQDLSCMLSSMALMTTYKRRKWYALLVIVLSTLDFRLSTAKLENILIHL